MSDYRVYIMGPDGHVIDRVDLLCDNEPRLLGSPNNSLPVTTSSFGNWIE